MPELGTWAWFSWLACICGEVTVSLLLLCSGQWRKYRAITGLVCWKSLLSFVLLGIVLSGDGALQNWLYFYAYYFGVIVSDLFSFLIISSLVTRFVDSAEMRYSLQVAVRYAGVAFTLGSLFYSFLSPEPYDPFYERMQRFSVCLSRGVSLAVVALFLVAVYAAKWLKMAWPEGSRGLALGFCFLQIGNLSCWLLISVGIRQSLGCAQEALSLACFATWTITLRSAVRFPARLCPAPKLV